MQFIFLLSSLFFISLPFQSAGQQFKVTPEGLRNGEDTSKQYVIIQADGLSAKKLYDNALKYIHEKYDKPDQAIKVNWDSVALTYDSYVHDFLIYNNTGAKLGIEAYYTTELRFYDGSVRYEIVALDMKGQDSNYKLLFKGNWLKSYIVFKNNGKIFKPQTRADIQNYFNDELFRISNFLKNN